MAQPWFHTDMEFNLGSQFVGKLEAQDNRDDPGQLHYQTASRTLPGTVDENRQNDKVVPDHNQRCLNVASVKNSGEAV